MLVYNLVISGHLYIRDNFSDASASLDPDLRLLFRQKTTMYDINNFCEENLLESRK